MNIMHLEEPKKIKEEDYNDCCPICGEELEAYFDEYEESLLSGHLYSTHSCPHCGHEVYLVEYSLQLEQIICIEDDSQEHPPEQ